VKLSDKIASVLDTVLALEGQTQDRWLQYMEAIAQRMVSERHTPLTF
jgi:hypothetical protein